MESSQKLEVQIVELIDRLPPLPSNIDYLMRYSNENYGQERKIIKMVSEDPGLCTDLLHIANAYSISDHHIETIEEAVKEVGILPLIQLVGLWYSKDIISMEFSFLNHLDEYFIHSQDISLSCRVLAEVSGMKQHGSKVLAVAGLIHDIGRLVIMLAAKKDTAPLMGTQWDKMKSIIHEEKDVFGMDHCIVGEQICKKWNFSDFIQEGILRHHTPLIEDDFSYLGAIIFLAHFLAYSDFTGEMLSKVLPIELCAKLDFNLENFKKARIEYTTRRLK
jgi:HD-like signal output (HDOD) protein